MGDTLITPFWKNFIKPFNGYVVKNSDGNERGLLGKVLLGCVGIIDGTLRGVGLYLIHHPISGLFKAVATPFIALGTSALLAQQDHEENGNNRVVSYFKYLGLSLGLTVYTAISACISPVALALNDGQAFFRTEKQPTGDAASRKSVVNPSNNVRRTPTLQLSGSGRVTPTPTPARESVSRQNNTPAFQRKSAVSLTHSDDGRELPTIEEPNTPNGIDG